MRRENCYRIRLTQGNPLQRPSEIFNGTICPLSYCTQGLEDGTVTLPLPGQTTVNEMSCIIEKCTNALPSSAHLFAWNKICWAKMEKEASKTARQQAVGETLAQKYSTFVKAIVHSEMNHLLSLMSFQTQINLFCWHKRRYFESLFYIKIQWMDAGAFKILKRPKITIKRS